MKFNFFITLVFFICSCGNNENKETLNTELNSTTLNKNSTNTTDTTQQINEEIQLRKANNYTHSEIAKFTISSIMGKNPKKLKVKKDNDNFIVSYTLDGKPYDYKVQFYNSKIK